MVKKGHVFIKCFTSPPIIKSKADQETPTLKPVRGSRSLVLVCKRGCRQALCFDCQGLSHKMQGRQEFLHLNLPRTGIEVAPSILMIE